MNQLHPRALVYLLFRRRWLFLGVASLCVGLAAAKVALREPSFESSARIMAKVVESDVAIPDTVLEQRPSSVATSMNFAMQIVQSQLALLTSRDVLKTAVESVGVARAYPRLVEAAAESSGPVETQTPLTEYAVKRLGADLTVQVQQNSSVLLAAVRNERPEIAQALLKALIAAYFDQQALINRDPRSAFLESQIEDLRTRVGLANDALQAFKRETGITSLEAERNLLLEQRDGVEASLNEAEAALTAARQKTATLGARLGNTPASVPLSNENDRVLKQADEARSRLAAAEIRYRQATQTFAEGNPELDDARAQYEVVRRLYDEVNGASQERVRTGANPVHQQLQSEIGLVQAEVTAQEGAIAERRKQLERLNERLAYLDTHEVALFDLQSRHDAAKRDFQAYVGQLEQARLVDRLNEARITSLGVLQQPTLPFEPSQPSAALLLILATVAGVMAGIGACLVIDALDRTFSLPGDVESALGVPVLFTLDRGAMRALRAPVG